MDDTLITCLVKGEERYIWVYRQADVGAVRRSLGRFASDPDLSFTWADAAVVSLRLDITKSQQDAANGGS